MIIINKELELLFNLICLQNYFTITDNFSMSFANSWDRIHCNHILILKMWGCSLHCQSCQEVWWCPGLRCSHLSPCGHPLWRGWHNYTQCHHLSVHWLHWRWVHRSWRLCHWQWWMSQCQAAGWWSQDSLLCPLQHQQWWSHLSSRSPPWTVLQWHWHWFLDQMSWQQWWRQWLHCSRWSSNFLFFSSICHNTDWRGESGMLPLNKYVVVSVACKGMTDLS